MVFRRRSKGTPNEESKQHAPEQVEDAPVEGEPSDGAAASSESGDPEGPWDIDAVPDSDMMRLDLGGLQIPTLPDVELRLDTDPDGAVVAVVLVTGASALRLGAFAAPRRAGIWEDVRAELLASLIADGGKGEERDGPFGTELLAAVPGEKGKSQTARFVGVDGPRWLLRGVFTGPSATNRVQAEVLEQAMREVVVARGGDALPVRDPLPLVLPQQILDQATQAQDEAREAPGEPRRGPEITEIG